MERVLRILLVLVAAIFLLTAFNKCNAQTKLYEYCDIVGANITEKNKLTPYFTVYLDDGKQSLPKPMQNEQGQDIKFPTTMAAVNYMAKKGWEVVQMYQSGLFKGYILRREIDTN